MFAGAARGAVFSNPEVIRRVKADFIPVALKAALVNDPPAGDEGRLYREIGRSKPAPQGICSVDAAGRVLAWSLMFDDDKSVVGFLDHVLERNGKRPPAAERFMKYPSRKLDDVADEGELPAARKHPEGERCPGAFGWPEGTLLGRVVGRAFRDGKPLPEIRRQEDYVEDRFEISAAVQEEVARAGEKLPDGFARALVGSAYLGMLDVDPLGAPGGKNDGREWEFKGRRDGDRIRFEGTSKVSGSQDRGGNAADGRLWSHEVRLTWKGVIELKGNRIARLWAVAEGREKLAWGNPRMAGGNEVAQLPAGRPVDFDGDVRYGLEARPVEAREIGRPLGPPADLPERMRKLGEAVRAFAEGGGDLRPVQPEMEKLKALLEKRDFDGAGKQIEKVLELVRKK